MDDPIRTRSRACRSRPPPGRTRKTAASEEGRWRWGERLTGGLGRGKNGSMMDQLSNLKMAFFLSPKSTKFLLELDKITNNIFQQESLKNHLYFGCSKKNKLTIFEFSKNLFARLKGHKIPLKYFKFSI
jgi:hypothetical protein